MRVRPVFWLFLLASCLSVLAFATFYSTHIPSILDVQIDQEHLTANAMAQLDLHLTDPQGLPIDTAEVTPTAYMTNMEMHAEPGNVIAHGSGKYTVRVHLYMAGPWAITIHTRASGFDPQQKTLFVQVMGTAVTTLTQDETPDSMTGYAALTAAAHAAYYREGDSSPQC